MKKINPKKEIDRKKPHVVWNHEADTGEYHFVFVGNRKQRKEDYTKMTGDIRKYNFIEIDRDVTGRVEDSPLKYILLTIRSGEEEKIVEECLTKRTKFRDRNLREKKTGRGGLLSVDVYVENNYGQIDPTKRFS